MKQPKPRPGSLPLKDDREPPTSESLAISEAAQNMLPPWLAEEPSPQQKKQAFTTLHKARKKAEELGEVVRDAAFDDWIRRCLVEAKRPNEWTQSRELYESYVRHAATYGDNRASRALSRQEIATETQWGKMMGSLFPNKKRRTRGWFYPVRPKQGA